MKNLVLFFTAFLVTGTLQAQIPAFPGAEGFGAYASGGRNSRKVVHVTNLNASGAGSFADALNGSDRIVVFDVGGVIKLSPSDMVAVDRHNNITVLGQTAPGDGITVYGNRVLIRNCSNVIFRYIRMRGSINMAKDAETLTMDDAENVILDHCSISWGRWDNIHIKNADNITWQYCLISEGIDPQHFGAITDGTRNWTINHCLWVDNHSRNPKMKCYAQMINSVVYNGGNGVVGGHSSADNYQDLINNYFIAGPDGNSAYSQWTATDHLYQKGNLMDGNLDGVLNGTEYVNMTCTNMDSPNFSPDAGVTVESPEDAYIHVLDQAGCSRTRDRHDLRIIGQVKSLGKEGRFIDSEEDVGGIGSLDTASAERDTDGDGIPDDWETANGLNPKDAADATSTADDGYLWIEKYANSLAAVSTALVYPVNVKVTYTDNTQKSVKLTWNLSEPRAVGVLVEQSTDGKKFVQVDSLPASYGEKVISDINKDKVYYFRLRSTDGKNYSNYSIIVKINEPAGIIAGGGTEKNTTVFMPAQGKLYRIICYASQYYSSNTNYSGDAQYLEPDSHVLKATTAYDWQNPRLLWTIQHDAADTTRFIIRSFSTRELLQSTVNAGGYACTGAGTADTPPEYTITFIGNQLPSKSGIKDSLSFYRLNSPDNKDYQLRSKSASQWFWDNGTIARADMAFTFQSLDSALIGLYTKNLQARITEGEDLIHNVITGTGTLEYPDSACDEFMSALEKAELFLASAQKTDISQVEIDSIETVLSKQIKTFQAQQNRNWGEYIPGKLYAIYSYGTASNSGTTVATSSTARRYLAEYDKGLVFRVGRTDAQEGIDTLITAPNAQWVIAEDGINKGNFLIQNFFTGNYLNVTLGNTINTAMTTYPVYNNTDNGKYAFTFYASKTNNRSLSIGTVDADGLGGELQGFTGTADRTRLRWILEPVSDVTSGVKEIKEGKEYAGDKGWYNMQGMKIKCPHHGLFIHQHKTVLLK